MNNSLKGLLGIVAAIVIAILLWGFLTMPDNRSTGQRIGDAVDELPRGVDKAADQLGDRTPGARIGDAVKDAGENIKDSTR